MNLPLNAKAAWTGRWAISRNAYTYLAPTSISSVVLVETKTYESREVLSWFVASAGGYLAFCAILFAAHKTIFRNRSVTPIPVYWVFILGAFAGVFKGLTTSAIALQLHLLSNPSGDAIQRVISAGVLGLSGVPAIALVVQALEQLRDNRNKIIAQLIHLHTNEIKNTHKVSAMTHELRNRVAKKLSESTQDASVGNFNEQHVQTWQELATNLRFTAENTVRQLSHELWSSPVNQIKELTLLDVARATVSTNPFPLRIFIPILTMTTMGQTFNSYPPSAAVLKLVLDALVISAIFSLASIEIKRRSDLQLSLYLAALLFASLTPIAMGIYLFHDTIDQQYIGTCSAFAAWVVVLATTCGLIDTMFKKQHELLDKVQQRLDHELIKATSEHNEYIRLSNEMAKYLHGNLQSRLMASALSIETAARLGDDRQLNEEIEKAESSLRTPFDQFALTAKHSLKEVMEQLVIQWQGIISIDHEIHGMEVQLNSSLVLSVSNILEECVSNALRHGSASEINFLIRLNESSLSIVAIDNGIGPGTNSHGLGAMLFNSLSGKNWELTRGPDGIGAQLNITLTY